MTADRTSEPLNAYVLNRIAEAYQKGLADAARKPVLEDPDLTGDRSAVVIEHLTDDESHLVLRYRQTLPDVCLRNSHDRCAARLPESPAPDAPTYEQRVEQVASALHKDCLLEWQAIGVVDPGRQITQHLADAHYGQAHDLVRRLWPELDRAALAPEPREP